MGFGLGECGSDHSCAGIAGVEAGRQNRRHVPPLPFRVRPPCRRGPAGRPFGPAGCMSLRLTASGLAGEGASLPQQLAALADIVLRGLGQVMFQGNSYAGLLFLVGIAVNSLLFAAAALIGCIIATLTAIVLGADRAPVRAGLFGFNGALVGIALLYFLQPNPLTWVCVALAAVCSTIAVAALQSALRPVGLPALTAPFVLVSLCFFLAMARFGRLESVGLLPTAGLPKTAQVEGVVTGGTIAEGLFTGVGQVFFQGNVVSGGLFLAGLFVSSRLAFAAALAGSFAGLLVAWGMGAAEPAIRAGAFGFNSVLTAIALAGVALAPGRASFCYALLGAIITPFVAAAAAAALEPLGLPALTAPFVLVTWLLLLGARGFARVRGALPPD